MAATRPAYAERLSGRLASLKIASFQLPETAPLPEQLDALWHFECVVSPRSPAAARSQSAPSSPRSPLFSSPARSLSLPSAPTSRSQYAAFSPSSSLSRFAPASPTGQHLLQRVFSTFDLNGDGSVSITEISRIFDRLGIPTSENSIQSLLASLATNSQGHVEEEEFLHLYETACSFMEDIDAVAGASEDGADEDQDLLAAFQVFDKDGNGLISPSELQSVLCSLGFPQASQLDACISMIARVDENGDGQVDFFEFKKLFHLENTSSYIQSW